MESVSSGIQILLVLIMLRKGSILLPLLRNIDPHVEDYADKAVNTLIECIEKYAGLTHTVESSFTFAERESTK